MMATGEFDRLLAAAIGGVFGLYLARCVLGSALAAMGKLPGAIGATTARWSRIVTPKLARRVAVALVGTAAATAAVAPANAVPAETGRSAVVVDRARPTKAPASTVTVGDGDCLWSLAQDQLGGAASDADIDLQWHRWYQLNKQRIGSDPNVVRTGLILTIPQVTR